MSEDEERQESDPAAEAEAKEAGFGIGDHVSTLRGGRRTRAVITGFCFEDAEGRTEDDRRVPVRFLNVWIVFYGDPYQMTCTRDLEDLEQEPIMDQLARLGTDDAPSVVEP